MSVVVLLAAGFPHDAVVVGITIGGAALAAAVIVPAVELCWCWLQAPMRLLTEDVIAIRERVERPLAPSSSTEPAPDVRLGLLDLARRGQVMLDGGYVYSDIHNPWAAEVVAFLSKYVPPADAEAFVQETALSPQVRALAVLAEKYRR